MADYDDEHIRGLAQRDARHAAEKGIIDSHNAKHQGNLSGTAQCQATGRTFEYHNMDVVPTLSQGAYNYKVISDHRADIERRVSQGDFSGGTTQSRSSRDSSSNSNILAWIIFGAIPASLVFEGVFGKNGVIDYFKNHGISDILNYIQRLF